MFEEEDEIYLEILNSPIDSGPKPKDLIKIKAKELSEKFGTVDIIFVRFNLKEVEEKALVELKKNTIYPFNLIDHDNYKKKEKLSSLWNRLIKNSKAKYICLLNTDAFVTEGWLTEIMEAFNDDKVAAVGPSGDKVGGIQRTLRTLQDANEHKNSYVELKGRDNLSGFCFVLKKSVSDEIGGFPKEVPFYGGEHAWDIKAKEAGYKLIWAQGAFVYHLSEASAKNEGIDKKLRDEAAQQYLKWIVKRIPILMVTYNRLAYTKQSLKTLIKFYPKNQIIIWDNHSTDGTIKWLRGQAKIHKNLKVFYSKKNFGSAYATNEFIKKFKNKEFFAILNNDTLIYKDWLKNLAIIMINDKVDILSPIHEDLIGEQSFENKKKNFRKTNRIIFTDYVSGTGSLIRGCVLEGKIPESEFGFCDWKQYFRNNPNILRGYAFKERVKLLDMKDNYLPDYKKFPSYYKATGKIESKMNRTVSTEVTFNTIKEGLNKDRFAYLRFGDGELLMIDDPNFKGTKRCQYKSNRLVEELTESFKIKSDNYLIGNMAGVINEPNMEPGLFASFDTNDFLKKITSKFHKNKKFYNPITLHYYSVFKQDEFINLVNLINTKKVGFVGSIKIDQLIDIFKIEEFVKIPPTQSYNTFETWYPKVEAMAEKVDIILFSAGMSANVAQKRLWKKNIPIITLDLGSVIEALILTSADEHTWLKKAKSQIDRLRSKFKKTPLVSILIPNKKGREITSIGSIKAQSYKNIEFVVSVDGGHGKNWAINQKQPLLSGKYLFVCDDDIILNHDCIEKMVKVLEQNENISFVYCDYIRLGSKSGILKSEPFSVEQLKNHNYISEMSLVRMKDTVIRDESIKKYTDWDFWRTLVDNGKIGYYIPETLFAAYYGKDCLSNMSKEETKKWFDIIQLKHN